MRRVRTAWAAALAALLAGAGLAGILACGDRESPAPAAPAESAADAAADAAAAAEVAAAEAEELAEEAAAEAEDGYMDPEAVEVVKRMVQALADAKALSVHVDEEYDALQPNGETFSFGKTVDLTMRRPDRMRTDETIRNGEHHITSYDGKQVAIYDAVQNVYAKAEHSGDIDSLVDFLRDDIGAKVPLAPLFSMEFGSLLKDNVTSATYIDEEEIDGVELDHVAFNYGEGVGVQLWVPRSGDPLPFRMVMTFEDAVGRPQFRADFLEWKLKPDVSDGVFAFSAPPGTRAVPMVLLKRPAVSAAGGEVSR